MSLLLGRPPDLLFLSVGIAACIVNRTRTESFPVDVHTFAVVYNFFDSGSRFLLLVHGLAPFSMIRCIN
jgi:hypothetical protein